MVVKAERWKHTVDMQEVHSFEEGFYSPSWIYMGLDFSSQVAAMEGFYNPSLTCMP